MAGSSQLGTRSFATFLPGDDLRDLRSVAHAKRAEAERKHRRFAQRRRDALRLLLLSAARYGALPHGRTRLADFDSSGKVTQTVFINLDEDLPGDNEFDPDAAVSGDAITGFPGETDEQFERTMQLVRDIGFDVVNTAAYSPRPNTPAADWDNQVRQPGDPFGSFGA